MIIAWDLLPTRFVDNKSCWSLTTRNVEIYNNIWIKYSYILYKSSNATYMPPSPEAVRKMWKKINFSFWLWFMVKYDLKRVLPKKNFYHSHPPSLRFGIKKIRDLSQLPSTWLLFHRFFLNPSLPEALHVNSQCSTVQNSTWTNIHS